MHRKHACFYLQPLLLHDDALALVLPQLYAWSAAAVPAGAPAERVRLQLQLLMPCCSLLAMPLYTKRLCHVALAEALLKPGGMTVWQVSNKEATAWCVQLVSVLYTGVGGCMQQLTTEH